MRIPRSTVSLSSCLYRHLDEKAVIERILPSKDVDAFHAVNVGKIMIGNYDFLPCTPAGVMELIHSTGIWVSGKECVSGSWPKQYCGKADGDVIAT